MIGTPQHRCLFLADLSPSRGTEPGKVRPVLVIQSDMLNHIGHPSTWILPCTTRLAGSNALRVNVPASVAGNATACEVMIDQSRSIDNQRFDGLLGTLPAPLLREVKEKLRALAEL